MYWILDTEHTPIETDATTWATWFEDFTHRRITQTTLPNGMWVSTVFLGFDHSFGEGPPILFETMVFKSPQDLDEQDMDRYASYTEAEAGHVAMVARWDH